MRNHFLGKSFFEQAVGLIGILSLLGLWFVIPKAQALTMQEILQGYDSQSTPSADSNGQVLGVTTRIKVKPIALEGRKSSAQKPKAKVELISPVTGLVLSTQNVDADMLGDYNVDFSALGSGPVDLRLTVEGFLAKKITIESPAAAGFSEISLPELTVGDVNNDGSINAYDANYLQAKWNKESLSSEASDLNGDGIINSFDFALIKNNLNKIGE